MALQQIDYGLLAKIPQSYMQGYATAQNMDIRRGQLEMAQRKMQLQEQELAANRQNRQQQQAILGGLLQGLGGGGASPVTPAPKPVAPATVAPQGTSPAAPRVAAPTVAAGSTPASQGVAPVTPPAPIAAPAQPPNPYADLVRVYAIGGDFKGAMDAYNKKVEYDVKVAQEAKKDTRDITQRVFDSYFKAYNAAIKNKDPKAAQQALAGGRDALQKIGSPLADGLLNMLPTDVSVNPATGLDQPKFKDMSVENFQKRYPNARVPEGATTVTFEEAKTSANAGIPVNMQWSFKPTSKQPTPAEDRKFVQSLRKEVMADPVVKRYSYIAGRLSSMQSIFKDIRDREAKGMSAPKIALDQVLITSLNKILDETSVVRESEYLRSATDQGFVDRILGYLPKLREGGAGLTNEARLELIRAAELMTKKALADYSTRKDFYTGIVNRAGFNVEDVIPNLAAIEDVTTKPIMGEGASQTGRPAATASPMLGFGQPVSNMTPQTPTAPRQVGKYTYTVRP